MLYIFGKNHVLKSLKLLCDFVDKNKDYQIRYLEALGEIHHGNTPINYDKGNKFIYDLELKNQLIDAFFGNSTLNDRFQERMVDTKSDTFSDDGLFKLCGEVLVRLKEIDNELYNIFDFCIHSIFTKKSNVINSSICNAASTSNAIGVIFINNNATLTFEDIMELLVHELTHCLLFIEETGNILFDYNEIVKKENYSMSAILNERRPLDKVIHSIIVAAQVLLFRSRYADQYEISQVRVHPQTSQMMNKTFTAIKDLKKNIFGKNVITQYAENLVLQTELSLKKEIAREYV